MSDTVCTDPLCVARVQSLETEVERLRAIIAYAYELADLPGTGFEAALVERASAQPQP